MKSNNYAIIFILLCILYVLSKAVSGGRTTAVNMVSGIIILWSLAYYVKAFFDKSRPMMITALMILVAMFTVYGLLSVMSGTVYSIDASSTGAKVTGISYLVQIYTSLMPIFAFYYFAKNGLITERMITKWIPLFLIVITIGSFFRGQSTLETKGVDEATNNYGYTFLSIMPMLMFYAKKSRMQLLSLGFCMLMMLTCMKRGAILIGVILMGMYFAYLYRDATRKVKRQLLVLIAVFVLIGFIAVNRIMSRSEYFQERVEKTEEGNASGRDVYYLFFVDYYLNHTTRQEFLIGQGANATLEIWSNYAHNDWLELAINQGLLGVIVFLFYWVAFFKMCRTKELSPKVKMALWMLFVVYFMKTLFSMSYRTNTLYSNIVFGYCIAYASQVKLSNNAHHKEIVITPSR